MEKEEITEEDLQELIDEETDSVNIPLRGSPLYPRFFIGESAKPMQGNQFPETEYVDDNINRTWVGLLTSFQG